MLVLQSRQSHDVLTASGGDALIILEAHNIEQCVPVLLCISSVSMLGHGNVQLPC